MIYLDNSATTFPKPPQVSMAMSRAMTKFGANPGRSGHRLAVTGAKIVLSAREALAAMWASGEPETPRAGMAAAGTLAALRAEK